MIKSAVELKSMRKRLAENLKVDKLSPKTVENMHSKSTIGKIEKKKKKIETKAFG